jgi:hypothetical protein
MGARPGHGLLRLVPQRRRPLVAVPPVQEREVFRAERTDIILGRRTAVSAQCGGSLWV